MDFRTLGRIESIENAIAQLEKAVLTLKTQIDELKAPVELKRETLTLRKSRG